MQETILEIYDQVNCRFRNLDADLRKRFLDALRFEVPYARHTPRYKLGRWDGKINFGTIGGGTYLNLLDRVLPMIVEAGYEITIDDRRLAHNIELPKVDANYISHIRWPKGHKLAGQPISLEPHQVQALNLYAENIQCIQELSTGAGKTVLSACMSKMVEPYGRSIVIVPSKSLVDQTEADYRNVGLDVGVFYGDRKEWNRTHTICTWQSLSVLAKNSRDKRAEMTITHFLEGVIAIITDEAHGAKANELRDFLCGPAAKVPVRWGMTGTIPKADYERLSLIASIGPVVGGISAAELQERGFLATCDIQMLQLQDSDYVEGFGDYASENSWLLSNERRLKFLAGYCIALAETGNTLILVSKIETGKRLQSLIPGSSFVYGQVKSKDRKVEFDAVQTGDNQVMIATFGVAAVGINIPRLFNAVFVEGGRSYVRSIQAAGRLLRKARDKDRALIVDVSSNLKYSKKHASERRSYYRDAQYPFTVTKVSY